MYITRYYSCYDPLSGNPSKTITYAVPYKMEEKSIRRDRTGIVSEETKPVEGLSNKLSVAFPHAIEITKAEYDAIDVSGDSAEFKKDREAREAKIAKLPEEIAKYTELLARREAAAKKIKEAKDKKPK